MTRSEHIRERGCIYDTDLPPSVPAGEPLRGLSAPKADEPHQRQRLRQSCTRALTVIRTRLGGD